MRDEIDGAQVHYPAEGALRLLRHRPAGNAEGTRLVAENADMVALAPYASRLPFETWILPKRHQSSFEDAWRHEYTALGG